MHTLKKTDMNGLPYYEGAIIMVHYPNPAIKFIGLLAFDEDELRWYLDAGQERNNIVEPHATGYEIIGDKSNRRLLKECGRIELLNKKDLDKIYQLSQQQTKI